MQKSIAFFVLLGIASSSYAASLGGLLLQGPATYGAAIRTQGSVIEETAHAIGKGIDTLNPFDQLQILQGFPVFGWVSRVAEPVSQIVGTVQDTMEKVPSVIPNVVNGVVKETKEFISHPQHHGY